MARRALGLPRVYVFVWSPLVQHLHCCLFYGSWCALVCVCIHSKHSIRSLCKICVHVFCDDMPLLHCVRLAYVPAALCARLALCVSVCCCVAPLMCSVCTISCVGGLRDEDQYLLRHSSPALEQDSPHGHLLAHLDCQDREELQHTLQRLENENRWGHSQGHVHTWNWNM